MKVAYLPNALNTSAALYNIMKPLHDKTGGEMYHRAEVTKEQLSKVDVAVFETIKDTKEGNFQAGTVVFGLKEDGVGLAPTTSNNTPQEVIDQVNALRDRIIAGEITVPTTAEDLESFTPPQ